MFTGIDKGGLFVYTVFMKVTKQTTIVNVPEPLPTWDEWTEIYRAKRRELMVRLYDEGRGISMTKIAGIYGVSKQRVQQIIRGEE